MASDPVLDALQQIMQAQATAAERHEELAGTVASLAERLALAESSSGATVPAGPANISHIEFAQAPQHAPLIEPNEENSARRVNIAVAMGILGTPEGNELVMSGARGLYRKLDFEGVQSDQPIIARHAAQMMVEDALLEDPSEAEEMGRHLLVVLADDDVMSYVTRNPHSAAIVGPQ